MAAIAKRFFFFIPFVWLILMAVLAFFQHGCADDFTCYFFSHEYGVGGGIGLMFSHGTGRYTSIPILLVLESSRFLLDNVWVGLLPLMAITYATMYFFLSYFLKAFFTISFSKAQRHWLAATAVLLLTATVPELSSFFFWLGTAIVYLVSWLIFMLYLVWLHKWYDNDERKKSHLLVLLLLVLLLCGFNELVMYYSFAVYSAIFLYRLFFIKKVAGTDILILVVHILVVVAVFLVPGNFERSAGYNAKQSIVYSMISGLYQTLQVFGSIFSSIFFWMTWVGILWLSHYMKPALKNIAQSKRTSPWMELLLLFLLVFVLAFGLRHATGHLIPARGKNVVVCISMLGLLLITLLNAHRLTGLGSYHETVKKRSGLLYAFGVLLLLFNPFTKDLLQSLINAPVHHTVLHNRIATIESVKRQGGNRVVLNSYQHDFMEIQKQQLGVKGATFVHEEFPAPPRFLYFVDDAVSSFAPYYAEYYNIDTIGTKDDTWFRIGLTWDFEKYKKAERND